MGESEWVEEKTRREKKWRRTRTRRRRPSDLKVRRKLFISHHASAPWTSTSDLSVPWKKNTPQNKNYHKVVIITGSILSSDWLIVLLQELLRPMACFRGNREEFYGEVLLLDDTKITLKPEQGMKVSLDFCLFNWFGLLPYSRKVHSSIPDVNCWSCCYEAFQTTTITCNDLSSIFN